MCTSQKLENLTPVKRMNVVLCVLIIISATVVCDCAKILGMISMPSYSHNVIFQPLWKELSLRGHQVTVITTDPINDPTLTNLTEIDLSFSYKIFEPNLSKIINTRRNLLKFVYLATTTFTNVCDQQLSHPQVQALINDPYQHFDLLIVEYLFGPPLYLSKRFNCPYIGVISADLNNLLYGELGNPTHPIIYPDVMSEIYEMPTMFERVKLVFHEIGLYCVRIWIRKLEEKLVQKHFQDTVSLREIWSNATLLFVNSNPVFNHVRPIVPSVIQIGGNLARIPVKPIEKEIKKFLDEAEEGFIYFSLGSNVKSKHIPSLTLNVILETFEELPYKILWKYENGDLSRKSSNVYIAQWVSQLDVLQHPNLKLFITHGGAQSLDEAIFARIPILGMPFFVDQPFNINRMVAKGCGLSVDYTHISKKEFKSSILEVINNPKYKNQIRKLADLAEDQPMTGLDRAVWWVEYVIRHKGAQHLRSPLLNISWYQFYLLDVIAIIVLVKCLAVYFIVLCIKIFRATFRFTN